MRVRVETVIISLLKFKVYQSVGDGKANSADQTVN